jgi:hypothetical protein
VMARLGGQTMITNTVQFRREAALGLPTTGGCCPAPTRRRARCLLVGVLGASGGGDGVDGVGPVLVGEGQWRPRLA